MNFTEVEHHIHELGQQLARLCHVECSSMFDMTILFCLMLELDRYLLTLLMSTIANLTMAIAREVFIYRHVFIQVRSTCVLTGMSARRLQIRALGMYAGTY